MQDTCNDQIAGKCEYGYYEERSSPQSSASHSNRPSCSSLSSSSRTNSCKGIPWCEACRNRSHAFPNATSNMEDDEDAFEHVSPTESISYLSHNGSRHTSSSAVDSGYHSYKRHQVCQKQCDIQQGRPNSMSPTSQSTHFDLYATLTKSQSHNKDRTTNMQGVLSCDDSYSESSAYNPAWENRSLHGRSKKESRRKKRTKSEYRKYRSPVKRDETLVRRESISSDKNETKPGNNAFPNSKKNNSNMISSIKATFARMFDSKGSKSSKKSQSCNSSPSSYLPSPSATTDTNSPPETMVSSTVTLGSQLTTPELPAENQLSCTEYTRQVDQDDEDTYVDPQNFMTFDDFCSCNQDHVELCALHQNMVDSPDIASLEYSNCLVHTPQMRQLYGPNGYSHFSPSFCSPSQRSISSSDSRTSLDTTLSTEAANSEFYSSTGPDNNHHDHLSPLVNFKSSDGTRGSKSRGKGVVWHTQLDYDLLHRRNPRLTGKQTLVNRTSDSYLGPAHSCPAKPKRINTLGSSQKHKDILCSTWPPSGKRIFLPDTEDEFLQEDDIIIEHYQIRKESVYEFNIPYKDIKLQDLFKKGKRRMIHKGQWHGDVMVHVFYNLNRPERGKFWEEVAKLSMTRHENIALFMGACMDPPAFAVVTSVRKGISLYDKLHSSREKTHQSFKLNVMRQICQAMGYLHARSKPIIVKRLNSKNIFLEPKVILCLLDYSYNEEDEEKPGYANINSDLLTYYAPEIFMNNDIVELDINDEIRTVDKLTFPIQIPETSFKKETDVYSFGTIMYELHTNRYPFHKNSSSPATIIQDVCAGKREDVKEMRCSETVKRLIRHCWSHESQQRPDFSHICRELMERYASHKRHSSSEPENVHRIMDNYSYF